MKHPSKEHVKDKVRNVQQNIKTIAFAQLSETLAKGIWEVLKN